MKEIYILYLILNKSGKLLKIGKTKESFKSKRFQKIDEDFKGAQFYKSYYVESTIQAEIDNLERILHKIFYKERKQLYYKSGVGKTEWFNSHILKDVFKQIEYLKKNNKNFSNLSGIKKRIELESKFRINYKRRAYMFFIFFILGIIIGFFLNKINITDII
jgi:hypothetical protein